MKIVKMALAVSMGVSLSACAVPETVTRNLPLGQQQIATNFASTDQSATGRLAQPQIGAKAPSIVRTVSDTTRAPHTILPEAVLRQINVAQINVNVPQTLSVSEANRYYPMADIVWRGDPIGNRHAQISKIVHEGMVNGTASFQGPVAVVIDVEVTRFHSVTEKARYTVGGVHNIEFLMVIRDATTGERLSPSRRVSTSLEAFGGQHAVAAENRGQTQKVRVTTHLGEVVRQQLVKPEMYEHATVEFVNRVNRI